MRTCSVQGCNGKHLAKGFCTKHYLRMYKNGTLKPNVLRGVPAYERLLTKILYEGDCWIFQGCKTWQGYGHIRDNGKMRMAHRISYEKNKGEIPEHLEIDHICKNRSCVNPDHLELVTHKENVRRGNAGSVHKNRKRDKSGKFKKED